MIELLKFLNSCTPYRAAAYMFFIIFILMITFTFFNAILDTTLSSIRNKIINKEQEKKDEDE
jgi:hypothetical protein